MLRRPPRSTRTDTLFPYTTLFLSKRPFADESIYSSGSSAAHNASLSRSVAQCPITPGRIGDDGERQEQWVAVPVGTGCCPSNGRSEEQTSELQSLMRISYAVFCLKKKKINNKKKTNEHTTRR